MDNSKERKIERVDLPTTKRDITDFSRYVAELADKSRSTISSEETRLTGEKLRKELREILRIIVQEYRQEGKVSSMAPTFSHMSEGQILLEALSHSNLLDKLQGKGIKTNRETLELIQQTLNGVQKKSPMPSDYNPSARIFNKILDKFRDKDFAALRVEFVDLPVEGEIQYNRNDQRYYGRVLTLTDPEGRVHVFNKGEDNNIIACSTAQCIEFYRNQYAAQWTQYWAQCGTVLTAQQIQYYNDQYNKGRGLTSQEVGRLAEGATSHGWTCTKRTFYRLEERIYYTDRGSKIYAVEISYEPYGREIHDQLYPPSTYHILENPTPKYNCYSEFIDREAWLIPTNRGRGVHEIQIRKILNDNGYNPVSNADAQIDDIVAYSERDGSISHIARVIRIDPDSRIIVASKLGDLGRITHEISDNRIMQQYGKPTIYHTERERGHSLLSQEPGKQMQSYTR